MNRYLRIGPYIVSLDHIHGVMEARTSNEDFPYQIYITYMDKTSVVLDMPNKEDCDSACDKIADALCAS